MRILLLLASFLFGTSFLFAQSTSATDSIPKHLIPLPEPISIILPIDGPPVLPYPWPGEGMPYQIPYPDWENITISVWAPICGDTKHPNGRLSSRIECENGIQHGRSTYWDEKGNKTSESYYIKGKHISSKNWDEHGRMTSWINYNGAGEQHGKYLSFDADNGHKLTTSYKNGIEHGPHRDYYNGKLTNEEIYRMGELIEHITYFEDGSVAEYSSFNNGMETEHISNYSNGIHAHHWKNDTLGHRIFDISRNERGVITREIHFKDSKPVGSSIDYYDDLTDERIVTNYEDGTPMITLKTIKGKLIQETKYINGSIKSITGFYENGDSSSLYLAGKVNLKKAWSENGELTEEYHYSQSGFLVDTGFMTVHDTLYQISAQTEPSDFQPIKVWVVYRGDTVRMDYVKNSVHFHRYPGQHILASNHYAKDPLTGNSVENGLWKYYNGNNLSQVTTFKNGIREGRAIFYSLSDDPVVTSTGNFKNDMREGEWITYSENGNRIETYLNGMQTGPYTYYYPSGRIHVKGTMVNFKQEGLFQEFHENNVLKYECTYVNGNRYGNSRSFDQQGRISREGMVINNTAAGIWYFYDYAPDGTVRRTKKKYSSRSELKRLIRQEVRREQSKDVPIATLSRNLFDGSSLC